MKTKRKFIIIAILVITFGITIFLWIKNNQQTQSQQAQLALSFRGITPGTSTRSDVEKMFGAPLEKGDGFDVYQSLSPTRPNNVVYDEEDKVTFIRESIGGTRPRKFTELTKIYGDPEYEIIERSEEADNADAAPAYQLFASPSKGIAFIANPIADDVLEIWYFSSTTIQDFIKLRVEGFEYVPYTPEI